MQRGGSAGQPLGSAGCDAQQSGSEGQCPLQRTCTDSALYFDGFSSSGRAGRLAIGRRTAVRAARARAPPPPPPAPAPALQQAAATGMSVRLNWPTAEATWPRMRSSGQEELENVPKGTTPTILCGIFARSAVHSGTCTLPTACKAAEEERELERPSGRSLPAYHGVECTVGAFTRVCREYGSLDGRGRPLCG